MTIFCCIFSPSLQVGWRHFTEAPNIGPLKSTKVMRDRSTGFVVGLCLQVMTLEKVGEVEGHFGGHFLVALNKKKAGFFS